MGGGDLTILCCACSHMLQSGLVPQSDAHGQEWVLQPDEQQNCMSERGEGEGKEVHEACQRTQKLAAETALRTYAAPRAKAQHQTEVGSQSGAHGVEPVTHPGQPPWSLNQTHASSCHQAHAASWASRSASQTKPPRTRRRKAFPLQVWLAAPQRMNT